MKRKKHLNWRKSTDRHVLLLKSLNEKMERENSRLTHEVKMLMRPPIIMANPKIDHLFERREFPYRHFQSGLSMEKAKEIAAQELLLSLSRYVQIDVQDNPQYRKYTITADIKVVNINE